MLRGEIGRCSRVAGKEIKVLGSSVLLQTTGNPWQHKAVQFGCSCWGCMHYTFQRPHGSVKMSHRLNVTFQKKNSYCFQSPLSCGVVGSTSHWKSVLIKCLSGNAGEQRHPKVGLEL